MLVGLSPNTDPKLASPQDAAAHLRESHPDAKIVYVGMAADLIHLGHINILKEGAARGRVIVGVLTDDAVASYKRVPIVKFEDRAKLIQEIKGVDCVVAQTTLDYTPNLMSIKPDFVVHGTDWQAGRQRSVREQVIKCLESWGGVVVEPEYTDGISTTEIIERCILALGADSTTTATATATATATVSQGARGPLE